MANTKKIARSWYYKFQYAAKFICTANIPNTSQRTESFVPGIYQTAVNIHNPQNEGIHFRMKITGDQGVSPFLEYDLGPDKLRVVNCSQLNMFNLRILHGFEGFLVIESTHSLDVVSIYTAAPHQGQVSSLEVEAVKERAVRNH